MCQTKSFLAKTTWTLSEPTNNERRTNMFNSYLSVTSNYITQILVQNYVSWTQPWASKAGRCSHVRFVDFPSVLNKCWVQFAIPLLASITFYWNECDSEVKSSHKIASNMKVKEIYTCYEIRYLFPVLRIPDLEEPAANVFNLCSTVNCMAVYGITISRAGTLPRQKPCHKQENWE